MDYAHQPGHRAARRPRRRGRRSGQGDDGPRLHSSAVEQLKEICERGANLQVDHIGIPWRHDTPRRSTRRWPGCRRARRSRIPRSAAVFLRPFFQPRSWSDHRGRARQVNERGCRGYLFTSFAPRLAKKGFARTSSNRSWSTTPAHARLLTRDLPKGTPWTSGRPNRRPGREPVPGARALVPGPAAARGRRQCRRGRPEAGQSMPASSAIQSRPTWRRGCRCRDLDASSSPAASRPSTCAATTDDRPRPHRARAGQVVAAICHAGWMLASAGIAKGRNVTCVSTSRTT